MQLVVLDQDAELAQLLDPCPKTNPTKSIQILRKPLRRHWDREGCTVCAESSAGLTRRQPLRTGE